MAITPVGVGALAETTLSSVAPAFPSGLATGDVLLASLYSVAGSTPTPPSGQGWTQVASVVASGVTGRATTFRKVFAAGDTTASFTGGGTTGFYGAISAWRGADTATPLDVAAVTATGSTGDPVASSVTAATAGAMVVALFTGDDNNEITTPITNSATLTYGGAGYSAIAGNDGCLGAAHKVQAAAGAVGTISANQTTGQPRLNWTATTVALRPAPTGPTVDAGADATIPVALAFTRTATETDNGSTITSRAWTIVSGPAGVGTTIGTATALSWPPTASGPYVVRYSATNANGTSTDDVAVAVLPSYVRDFRVAQTSTSTVTVPHPAGAQDGDPMVAFCINDFIAATATGWTRDSAAGSSASDSALNIFRRVATATETDHVFDVGASTSATVAVVAFNKLEIDTTWDVAPELATLSTTASTTTPAAPSITTVEAKALLLTVYGTVEGASHGLHTPPTGMTEIVDFVPSGTGRGLHIAAVAVDPAGATGTKTATTAGTAKIYVAQAMAATPQTAEQVSLPDTATVSDTLAVGEVVTEPDTAVWSDTATAADGLDLPDTVTLADTAAIAEHVDMADPAVWSDTFTSADVPEERAELSDAATWSDTLATFDADTADTSETVAVGDSLELLDDTQLPDTATWTATFTVADGLPLTDPVTVGDLFTVEDGQVDTEPVTVSDSLTVAETVTPGVGDTVTWSDTLAVFDLVDPGEVWGWADELLILDVPFTVFPVLDPGPRYELVAVARLPQAQGPPIFMEIDPIEWRSLKYVDTLSLPQGLDATALLTRLPSTVLQRLERPRTHPTELWLYRDGRLVFAGPLTGWSKGTDSVTVQAAGVLAYTWAMFVETDLRFDQVDQFTIARTLIDNWQASENGHFGIDTSAVGESGILRDATYARTEIHKLGQRIEELGRRRDGFDVDIDPTTRRLELWHPGKGVDRSVGEDAVVIDERSITSGQVACSVAPGDLASEGFGAGSASGGDTTLWSHQTDVDVRATYGRTGVAGTWSDVSDQATLDAHVLGMLDARGDALLIPGPGLRVTPDADLSTYGVGDTILYDESHALLGVVGAFRIRKREVSVAQDGSQESVTVEFV